MSDRNNIRPRKAIIGDVARFWVPVEISDRARVEDGQALGQDGARTAAKPRCPEKKRQVKRPRGALLHKLR